MKYIRVIIKTILYTIIVYAALAFILDISHPDEFNLSTFCISIYKGCFRSIEFYYAMQFVIVILILFHIRKKEESKDKS